MNGGYVYDGRYLLDVNLRSDGTSVFGANKRFSTTWSVGLAWNVHREKFMKDKASFINVLKLRGSVGNPETRISVLIRQLQPIISTTGC